MSKLTREITVDVEITPYELAAAFCEMDATDQALFFGHIWQIAKAWPGAGLCRQSHAICEQLDLDGEKALETMASHLPDEVLKRITVFTPCDPDPLLVQALEALRGLIGGTCPDCKGWSEVAYFGEMVRCKCGGNYRHQPSDNARAKAAAILAQAKERGL